MHTHGIHVLNGADNDHVVISIPHNLKLILFPAQQTALKHNLGGHGQVQACCTHLTEFLAVIGHTTPGAAQGKTGAHYHGKADLITGSHGRLNGVHNG